MLFQINQILAIVTSLLLIIFSVFLLTIKKEKKLNLTLLFIFLVINAAYLGAFLVISISKPAFLTFFIFFLLHSTGFLFGPVIFLYTRSTVSTIEKIDYKELVHFIPFLCALLYILFRFLIFPYAAVSGFQKERFYFDLILNIQVMLYMIVSIIEVGNYRKKIMNYYSSVEKLNFYWLSIVLYGFFFMWIIDFINFFLRRFFLLPQELHSAVVTLSILTNFIFAVLIFYEGLKHPQFFHVPEEAEARAKYEKSRLTEEETDGILNKLLSYMEEEKPYLNPSVTINDIAEKLNLPLRHLSQVINDSLNKNFYDFINSYRVQESMSCLADSRSDNKTILEILYESGFNSKSTFYKVFKDQTGENPTEFRKRQKSEFESLKK